MKNRIITLALALLMVFGSAFSFIGTNVAHAQEEVWTEEDFLYSSPGHIIAFSDKGIEKQKRTSILKFPEGTKSVTGNYSLKSDEANRFDREFGRGKVYEQVILPDSVTSLGYAAFFSAKIGKVKLSENLKSIGGLVFFSCELSEVNLPEGLTFLGHNAFERNHLEEITIPESVNKIDDYAFSGNRLHTIKVLGNPSVSEKGVFHKQQANYSPKQNPFYEAHFGYNGKIGLKEIPEGLTYSNGEFSFVNDQVESVEAEFFLAGVNYSGKISIYNPHKWSGGNQTDLGSSEIDELNDKIAGLEDHIDSLTKEKEENIKTIEDLKKELENCKSNGQELKEKKEQLEKDLREKEDEISRLKDEITSLNEGDIENKAEINQLEDEVKALQKENAKLEEDLAGTRWELEAEREKTESNEDRIKELEEKIEKQEKTISNQEKTIEEKQGQIKELENSLEETEEGLKKLEDDLSKKESEKENCCKKIEALEKAIKDLESKDQEKASKLEEEIDSLNKKVEDQEKDILGLQEELDKQVEQVKKLTESQKKYEEERIKEREESKKQAEDYKKNIDDLLNRQKELEKVQKEERERRDYKLEVDEVKKGEKEVTGKTQADWYVDLYDGNKRLGGTTSDRRGYFTIGVKEAFEAGDKLKVIAEDKDDSKKNIELTVEVKKDKEAEKSKEKVELNPVVQQEELLKKFNEFTVFQIGKNYYNIISKDRKTTVYMDVEAYIENDRTMLPVRYVAYALGLNVEYNNDTREAIFSNKENSALLKKTLYVNIDTGEMRDQDGNRYQTDAKPKLIKGRIHASISNIAKAFEASHGDIEDGKSQTIEWDQKNRAVYVFKNVK